MRKPVFCSAEELGGRGQGNRVDSPSFWSPSLVLSSIQTTHSLLHLWLCALLFHHTWYSSCVPLCPQPGPRSFSSYLYYFSSYTEHYRYDWLYLNSQMLLVSLGLCSTILSIQKCLSPQVLLLSSCQDTWNLLHVSPRPHNLSSCATSRAIFIRDGLRNPRDIKGIEGIMTTQQTATPESIKIGLNFLEVWINHVEIGFNRFQLKWKKRIIKNHGKHETWRERSNVQ